MFLYTLGSEDQNLNQHGEDILNGSHNCKGLFKVKVSIKCRGLALMVVDVLSLMIHFYSYHYYY